MPREMASPPASVTWAASAAELLSGIWAPLTGSPAGTSSSPVDRIATRGRGCTCGGSVAGRHENSDPMRGHHAAGGQHQVARADVAARARLTDVPGLTATRMPTLSGSAATPAAASVSSTRTTASAPGGSIAPVRMRIGGAGHDRVGGAVPGRDLADDPQRARVVPRMPQPRRRSGPRSRPWPSHPRAAGCTGP